MGDVWVSGSTIYPLLAIAFALATCRALLRGDGSAALAMGFGGVLAAHGAKLPPSILGWSATVMVAALVASVAGLFVGAVAGLRRRACHIGVASTLAMLIGTLPVEANSFRSGLAEPPALGRVLSSRLGTIIPR